MANLIRFTRGQQRAGSQAPAWEFSAGSYDFYSSHAPAWEFSLQRSGVAGRWSVYGIPTPERPSLYTSSSASSRISSKGFFKEVADSWSAGFACKRKQSLHSRCNNSSSIHNDGHRFAQERKRLGRPYRNDGVPQALVYNDERSGVGTINRLGLGSDEE